MQIKRMLSLLLLTACATEDTTEVDVAELTGVTTGTPNYTVSIGGCNGVILNARWILTSAKCIGTPGAQTRTILAAQPAGVVAVWSGSVQTYIAPADTGTLAEQAWHDVGLIHLYKRGIDLAMYALTPAALMLDAIPEDPEFGASGIMAGWGNAACSETGNILRRSAGFPLIPSITGHGYSAYPTGSAPGACELVDRGGPLLFKPASSPDLVAGWFSRRAWTPNPGAQNRMFFTAARENTTFIGSTIAANTSYALDTSAPNGSSGGIAVRNYNVAASPVAGPIKSGPGLCLQRSATGVVTSETCTGASNQRWAYDVTGKIKTTDATPACLRTTGGTINVAACAFVTSQFFYTSGTAIKVDSGSCLSGGTTVGSAVTVQLCPGGTSNQVWTIVN